MSSIPRDPLADSWLAAHGCRGAQRRHRFRSATEVLDRGRALRRKHPSGAVLAHRAPASSRTLERFAARPARFRAAQTPGLLARVQDPRSAERSRSPGIGNRTRSPFGPLFARPRAVPRQRDGGPGSPELSWENAQALVSTFRATHVQAGLNDTPGHRRANEVLGSHARGTSVEPHHCTGHDRRCATCGE